MAYDLRATGPAVHVLIYGPHEDSHHRHRTRSAGARLEPAGLLRIGAPVLFAPAYIVPAVAAFMERHPGIEVELVVSDRAADLIEERLDLAIRIREMADSSLKARRLGGLRMVAFGSPAGQRSGWKLRM